MYMLIGPSMFNKPCSGSVRSSLVGPVMAPHSSQGVHMNTLNCQKKKKSDDARKSIDWNASDYGDGFLVLKRKEETIKDDHCNPTKNPPIIKSVFSLEQKK